MHVGRALFLSMAGLNSIRRKAGRHLGLRDRLLLPALPRTALARGASVRPALRGVYSRVRVVAAGTIRVPADDQQSVAEGVQTADTQDARSESKVEEHHRGRGRAFLGAEHRGVSCGAQAEPCACARSRVGAGSVAGYRRGLRSLLPLNPTHPFRFFFFYFWFTLGGSRGHSLLLAGLVWPFIVLWRCFFFFFSSFLFILLVPSVLLLVASPRGII
jgi:hypothetical protein